MHFPAHGAPWGAAGGHHPGAHHPRAHHPGGARGGAHHGHVPGGGGGLHTPPASYQVAFPAGGAGGAAAAAAAVNALAAASGKGGGGDVLEGKLLAAVHQQQHGSSAPGIGAGGVAIPAQDIPHQLLPYGGAPPAPLLGVGGGAARGKARGGRRGGAGGRGGGKDGAGGKAGGGAPKGAKGGGGDGKPFVSHSVAEKQRRDRINTLIDELREIVPAQARGSDGGDGGSPTAAEAAPLKENAKRPKHEVLADTITLMRRLLANPDTMHIIKQGGRAGEGFMVDEWDGSNEDDLEAEEGGGPQEVADLEGGEVLISVRRRGPGGTGSMGNGSDGREGSANSGEGLATGGGKGASASAQKGGPASSDGGSNGSAQPAGSDKMTVTVKCADRYGLLHTLTSSLKSMGLRTQTAVVSTSADGIVKDTFKVDRASCALECDEIKATLLEDIIQGSSLTNIEPKRKRSSAEEGG